MRLVCAVLDDFQQVATELADWSPLADDVKIIVHDTHFADEDTLAAALADVDLVVTLRERVAFPGSLIARLPRLKLIVASGMRNNVIDYAAAEAHGVTVCGTASSSVPPVELTWALLLGLARGVVEESNSLRGGGPWQHTVGADLHGRRLGLLGLGKIGSRVAQVGLAFGMHVSAWSQNLTKERADEASVELAASKEELLCAGDFVSIHLGLGDRTRGLLGPAELALLKPTAYLINTSRAAIVAGAGRSVPDRAHRDDSARAVDADHERRVQEAVAPELVSALAETEELTRLWLPLPRLPAAQDRRRTGEPARKA